MADEIEDLISGGTTTAPIVKPKAIQSSSKTSDFDVNKSYGTPARLLDNLNQTESSGNPYVVQKDTKAMGNYQFLPDTAAMLHKQGIKFNAFDPKESRAAADYYIQQLVKQNGGDYNAAMSKYGGIKKTDPTLYLSKVMNGVDFGQVQPQQTQPQQAQQAQPQSEDEIANLITGSITPKKPQIKPQIKPSIVRSENTQLTSDIPTMDNTAVKTPVKLPVNTSTSLSDIGKKYAIPALETVATLGSGATTGLMSGIISMLTPASKEYIDKERKAWKAQNPDLSYNRFEQEFLHGMQTGTYQPKTKGSQEALEAIGNVLSTLPPTMPHELTTANVKPVLAGKMALSKNVAKEVEPGVQTIITPAAEKAAQAQSLNTPAYLRKQFAEKQSKQPVADRSKVEQPIVEKPVVEQPIVEIPIVEENPVPRIKPVSKDEMSLREKEMRDIGIQSIRKSALSDNPKESSSQLITSQADQGPYGSGITNQINHEKEKLDTHFKNIEEKLGGSVVEPGSLLQEEQKMKAGQNIKNGVNAGFENWNKETKNLYNAAHEEHGDKPVQLNNFNDFYNKSENFAYQKESELKNAINGVLDRKNLINEDGSIKPMTVADAEELRQLINKKYHYEVASVSSDMKNAIDEDVFSQVGGKVYQDARKHFGEGKDIYENPKAMNNLLGDKGINEKWTDEQVITKVNSLPQKQFAHLYDTLIKDGQSDAINQIKTSLINQVRQAGKSELNSPFNSPAATKQAGNLGAKIRTVFADDPKTMDEILKGLRVAKYIHIPARYQGAGVQTHLLKNKLLESGIQKAGSAAGGGLGAIITGGNPIGAMTGAAIGESGGTKLANIMKAGRQLKQLKKEIK